MPPTVILHVDMDAFYASIEQRDRPELRGLPVVVGGRPGGRGVVAAASYEARAYGVRSAMPSSRAVRLCPEACFLPPRMAYYASVSEALMELLGRYSPAIEPLALDEAFMDVSGSERLFGQPEDLARRIKREVRDELGLVASVGVAPNKFLAKLASDLRKPDGLVVVVPDRVQAFLDPLPVGALWGVGRVSSEAFRALGVRTVGDLRRQPPDRLKARFGRHGEHLWELAHGRDARRVSPEREAKSVSHETTFEEDVEDPGVLRTWLMQLAAQVARRLRRAGLRGRTIQIKLRFSDFRTITRARSLPEPTDLTRDVCAVSAALLAGCFEEGGTHPVRLVGVGVAGLDAEAPRQGNLFGSAGERRAQAVDAVLDAVNERYGGAAIRRGGSLPREER